MTAKELAKILNLSEAAVSFALNGKPGVSTQTRNRVREAAEKYGLDTSRFDNGENGNGQNGMQTLCLIYFRRHGAVLTDSSFFNDLTEGIENGCAKAGCQLNILNIYSREELQRQIEELPHLGVSGILLLGTEMQQEDFNALAFAQVPVLLLDNHFISSKIDSVQINNADGAYTAANYMINRLKQRPGYLRSSYRIMNFDQRKEGFDKALRYNGLSAASTIIHELTPSIDGAYSDMKAIIDRGEMLARCYFADNDQIAIGAMRAFKEHGLKIPQDIAIIGFDDIAMCSYTEPPLSSVHVPKRHMGLIAVERLLSVISHSDYYPVNVQISTNLVLRGTI